MAKIIDTANLNLAEHDGDEQRWIYNGLDAVVTAEVLQALLAQADDVALRTYEFSKALQAPVLEMNLRGMLVNKRAKLKLVQEIKQKIVRLEEQLHAIVCEGIGVPEYNWRSPKQTNQLLYSVMGLPVQKKRNSVGVWAASCDRKALEKLSIYFIAEPIVNHMLLLRDLGKALGFLETPLVRGRMITEYQIAGTKIGRLASSRDDEGDGTNMQNINRGLRHIFVADPGYKLCNLDLEQADSRNVGALCWNLLHDKDEKMAGAYLDACESGDLHTIVTKMVRSDLPWGTAPDREIADRIFYRDKSYRDGSKALGHGTNFLGQPPQLAMETKIPIALVKEFQPTYFRAFPAIPLWHQSVFWQLENLGYLQNLFGRRRFFFGRPKEGETRRQGVAYEPASMTADEANHGMLKLWRENKVQLLGQGHDAILFQYREDEEETILSWAIKTLPTPLVLARDREFVVPVEAKVGWNWGDFSENNPDGLKKWKGGDERKRTETQFQLSLADF
jgi:DNA polymerase-1